jgi:hypothetical protein
LPALNVLKNKKILRKTGIAFTDKAKCFAPKNNTIASIFLLFTFFNFPEWLWAATAFENCWEE